MGLRNILILAANDFLCALRNKGIYLILFIPVFIFLSLHFASRNRLAASQFKVALIDKTRYSETVTQAMGLATQNIEILHAKTDDEAQSWLRAGKVDAALESAEANRVEVVVLRRDSLQTLVFLQVMSDLQKVVEKNKPSWVADVKAIHEGSVQKQTLPTWILMLVLLVAFIILPAQVADEKDKKVLLTVLQTPVHETDWLLAKVILGVFLSVVAVVLLQALSQNVPANLTAFILFLIVGSYCFSAFGIFLGFLCRNQSSARTLGLVFYLPLLVPAVLSDFSQNAAELTAQGTAQKLGMYLSVLPSYRFFQPLQAMIFESHGSGPALSSWLYLFGLGSILLGLSYLLLKKRVNWLL